MISKIYNSVFSALSAAFNVVDNIFSGLGLSWVGTVSIMVLISIVLRLFCVQLVGSAIGGAISSGAESLKAKKADRNAKAQAFAERRKQFYVKRESAATRQARINSGKEVL